jgi:hypothetical protein
MAKSPVEVLKEQSAVSIPEVPIVKVPLPAPHLFADIERQNALEELGITAHVDAMTSIDITPTTPTNRPGQFPIKVVGNPYAGFAKGPRDTK